MSNFSFVIDENLVVELMEADDKLIIRKKEAVPTLDELLASIPEGFEYPDDLADFVNSEAQGEEIL